MCPLELTLLIQYQPGYHIGYGATEYVYTEYTRSTIIPNYTLYVRTMDDKNVDFALPTPCGTDNYYYYYQYGVASAQHPH